MMRLLLVFTALQGCGPSIEDSGEPATVLGPTEAFRAALQADGNQVRDGLLYFSTFENCCGPDANCLGNNPATPYGTYALPRLPEESVVPDYFEVWGQLPDPDLTRSYRLRPDEALVYIGSSPPSANYLGVHSYLVQRPTGFGGFTGIIGSLGATVNNNTVAADMAVAPDQIFDQPFVLLTTADLDVETRLRNLLISSGFDAKHIHNDRIAHDLTVMGLGEGSDTFGHIWRVAVDHDASASQAFRDDPGAVVLRVTPNVAQPIQNPHPTPVTLERGTGTHEGQWLQPMGRLRQAILDHNSQLALSQTLVVPSYFPSMECLEDGEFCHADTPDRFNWLTNPFLLDEPGEFVVVFGVNHERTGKATYANVALIEQAHQIGFAGFDSRQMVGSALFYLPNEPMVDDLYAYTLSRDCTAHPEPCVEIPSSCPGPPVGVSMRLNMRAYLEVESGTAPHEDEMVKDDVFIFRAP